MAATLAVQETKEMMMYFFNCFSIARQSGWSGLLALFVLALLVSPSVAQLQGVSGEKTNHAQSHLIVGTLKEDTGLPVLQAGIRITLADGWKAYWRNPGDAGLPMSVSADGSTNVSEITQLWPAPTRFLESWGLEVFGYKKQVVLPVLVTLKQKDMATTLQLVADYSICKDICIPYKETLMREIPVGFLPDTKEVAQIQDALNRVPVVSTTDGLGISFEGLEWKQETEKGGMLTVNVTSGKKVLAEDADLFVEVAGGKGFRFPKPVLKSYNRKSGYKTTFTFTYEKSSNASLAGQELMVTLVSGQQAVEAALKVPAQVQKKG